jgi:putative transposase
MARQPRLILPGHAHLVQQRGHNGQAIVHDTRDAETWLKMLREVAATHRVAVHAWCLTGSSFMLMATPQQQTALSQMLQDLGRRYVGFFNARHGRTGTLWDGRFRCAALEPAEPTLLALQAIEHEGPVDLGHSSRAHHVGDLTLPWLVDPPAYWALGNTPFDRHLAWQRQLERGLSRQQLAAVEKALRSGIPLGRAQWLQQLQKQTHRSLFPKPRGRPRHSPAS